jgi:hypothetical protein
MPREPRDSLLRLASCPWNRANAESLAFTADGSTLSMETRQDGVEILCAILL